MGKTTLRTAIISTTGEWGRAMDLGGQGGGVWLETAG